MPATTFFKFRNIVLEGPQVRGGCICKLSNHDGCTSSNGPQGVQYRCYQCLHDRSLYYGKHWSRLAVLGASKDEAELVVGRLSSDIRMGTTRNTGSSFLS
jgi:hypothetical protein